jgi:hypothetical protein
MVNRFHDNVDDEVRPLTGAANAKELNFADLERLQGRHGRHQGRRAFVHGATVPRL